MNKYVLGIFGLLFFSCNSIKSIHYGHNTGELCYNVYYNNKLKIRSFDGVEYHIYKFYINNDSLYLTNDRLIPPENSTHIMRIINNDSILAYDFTFYNKFPIMVEGKDENGYYYNYTDTIINIGYSNVKSKKSKKHFDYIIRNLKKCEE